MKIIYEQIRTHFQKLTQTDETLMRKLQLRNMLFYSLFTAFPFSGLYIVDSSLNGFVFGYYSWRCNGLLIGCWRIFIFAIWINQQTDALNVLRIVAEQTRAVLQEQTLIVAKVPILRSFDTCTSVAKVTAQKTICNVKLGSGYGFLGDLDNVFWKALLTAENGWDACLLQYMLMQMLMMLLVGLVQGTYWWSPPCT